MWDGTATLAGNSFETFSAINQWNIDKPLRQASAQQLAWVALTTGGFGGFDAMLADAHAGRLAIDTPLVKTEVDVAAIGLHDTVLATGGGIARQMRMFRLPDHNSTRTAKLTRRIPRSNAEDALYVCITLEDGHRIWSSPTYLLR